MPRGQCPRAELLGTSQQVEITVDAEDEVELFNGGVNSITLHGAPAIGAIVEIQKIEELL